MVTGVCVVCVCFKLLWSSYLAQPFFKIFFLISVWLAALSLDDVLMFSFPTLLPQCGSVL